MFLKRIRVYKCDSHVTGIVLITNNSLIKRLLVVVRTSAHEIHIIRSAKVKVATNEWAGKNELNKLNSII